MWVGECVPCIVGHYWLHVSCTDKNPEYARIREQRLETERKLLLSRGRLRGDLRAIREQTMASTREIDDMKKKVAFMSKQEMNDIYEEMGLFFPLSIQSSPNGVGRLLVIFLNALWTVLIFRRKTGQPSRWRNGEARSSYLQFCELLAIVFQRLKIWLPTRWRFPLLFLWLGVLA